MRSENAKKRSSKGNCKKQIDMTYDDWKLDNPNYDETADCVVCGAEIHTDDIYCSSACYKADQL